MITRPGSVQVDGGAAPSRDAAIFRPGDVWLDADGVPINAHGGGFLRDRDRVYWYGEHKTAGREGNSAQVGISCYSSSDLLNWRNEGIVLGVADVPGHDIERGCVIERPKVAHCRQTGEYVMWFHLELKGCGYSSARCGVAVSHSLAGEFLFVESFRPNGQMARDMTLFVDDDDSAYVVYASEENQTLHIAQLTDDYRRVRDRWKRVFDGRSMEAPAVFKHRGRYFFMGSGCTGWDPNPARSAAADSVWGPWAELGNPCVGPGHETTFGAQSTYILPVPGREGAFVLMADRWRPDNPIDGRYVWLPIRMVDGGFRIEWREQWDLSVFDEACLR